MPPPDRRDETPRRRPPLAAIQTSWGTIQRLFSTDPAQRSSAWREFHTIYRPSIVAYVRNFLRRGLGYDPGDELAEDVAQGFIVESYEKESLARADPAKGKFRAYLQGAIHHHCCNWLDHRNAQRRNPPSGSKLVSVEAARQHGHEPGIEDDPAAAFDRAWTTTLLGRALDSLKRANAAAGAEIEEILRATDAPADAPRAALTPAERTRRHRALEKLRAHFAAVVAETVSSQGLRDEEWKALAKYLPEDLRDPAAR